MHHHHHLLLLPGVLLIQVVVLILTVLLLLDALPLPLLLRVHLPGVVPLPFARELFPITDPLPMMVVTVTVTIVTILVHLYTIPCVVALGALAGLVVVVLWGVLGQLLDKEKWLGMWVLVWEKEVVVRKVVREVLMGTMILARWVLGGAVGVVVGW